LVHSSLLFRRIHKLHFGGNGCRRTSLGHYRLQFPGVVPARWRMGVPADAGIPDSSLAPGSRLFQRGTARPWESGSATVGTRVYMGKDFPAFDRRMRTLLPIKAPRLPE